MVRSVSSALMMIVAIGLSATTTLAHHSHPDFLTSQDATVEGTVEQIDYKNPHVVITLRAADSAVYMIEWQGAQWLRDHPELVSPLEAPVQRDTLKPGDFIAVTGAPAHDSSLHELVVLKRVERPVDGWLWTCRRPDRRITC